MQKTLTVQGGVAAVAASTLRFSDLISRWGGEEFVVLLPVDAAAAGSAELKGSCKPRMNAIISIANNNVFTRIHFPRAR